jgi:hypothetical protein
VLFVPRRRRAALKIHHSLGRLANNEIDDILPPSCVSVGAALPLRPISWASGGNGAQRRVSDRDRCGG